MKAKCHTALSTHRQNMAMERGALPQTQALLHSESQLAMAKNKLVLG